MILLMIVSALATIGLSAVLGPWDWIVGVVLGLAIAGMCLDVLLRSDVQEQE